MRSKGPRYDMAGRLPALQSFLLLPVAYCLRRADCPHYNRFSYCLLPQAGRLPALQSFPPVILSKAKNPRPPSPIACCLLPIGYWLLPIGYWLLPQAGRLPALQALNSEL